MRPAAEYTNRTLRARAPRRVKQDREVCAGEAAGDAAITNPPHWAGYVSHGVSIITTSYFRVVGLLRLIKT